MAKKTRADILIDTLIDRGVDTACSLPYALAARSPTRNGSASPSWGTAASPC